jgi:hypothetical protein
MRNQKRLAAIGVFLILPALVLCLSGLLKFDVPYSLIHPALVIGGLVGALALKLRGSLINLCVASLSLALLGVIALYVFVENFQPR